MADAYTHPTEVVELPSAGYFYPEGHPLSSGKVEIKYMTAKEEDILSNQSYIKKGTVMDKLLEGKEFNMGNHLSTLSIVRRDRDPRSPRIDWGESNKYKQELLEEGQELYNSEINKGVKWHVYHTDEFYCKYYWRKGKCKVPNKSVYRFDATRGIKGNKEKLISLLKEDELSYLKFRKHE